MSGVSKSILCNNPILKYCSERSTPMHPVQLKLIEDTLKMPMNRMLGAPEVLNFNAVLMKSLGAKRILDIGVFTGASSLCAALAIPEDGEVIACDVSEDFTNIAKGYWAEAGVDKKIKLHLAPATETLQKLLDDGQAGTFDFSFIDADKPNYGNYYDLSLQLLRKGGIIVVDNALWSGKVIDESCTDQDTESIRALNDRFASDPRVQSVILNIGDGVALITKL